MSLLNYLGGVVTNPLGTLGGTVLNLPNTINGIINPVDPSKVLSHFGPNPAAGATSTDATLDAPATVPQGTTGGGSTYNPAYNQSLAQLNQAEQRAGNQYGVAQQNVNNGYTDAFKRLTDANDLQQQQFKDTRLGQNQDYQSGRQDINQSVGNAYTGLQRLLGSRGAGNSSAASVLAPYAAGQQGNIQSTNLQNTYGKNATLLDNSIASYNSGFDNSKKDLETQKQTNLNAAQTAYNNAKTQILQSRQALNPGNANAYQQQINQLLGQVDQLALKPTYVSEAPKYTSPELAALQAGQIAPASIGGVAPGAVQQTGAFANLLGEDKKKQLVGQSPVVA